MGILPFNGFETYYESWTLVVQHKSRVNSKEHPEVRECDK